MTLYWPIIRLSAFTLFLSLSMPLMAQHFEPLDAPWLAEQQNNSSSCAWGDADGDGDLDLFVTSGERHQENEFYENLGNGQMRHRPDLFQKPRAHPSFGAAWGDYDNDGDLDLYVANAEYQGEDPAPNFLYRNEGGLQFSLISDTPIVTDPSKSYATAWVDLDNDGDLDLSIFNAYGSPNRLYLNNGEPRFFPFDGDEFSDLGRNNTSGSWADFDNDGDADCLVIDTWKTYLEIYQNEGDGQMTWLREGEHAIASAAIWRDRSAAWADVNKDGWQDVIIRRLEGAPLLFMNDGTGDFDLYEEPFLNSTDVNPEFTPSQSAVWGDFDADGDLDLQLPVSFRQQHEFYRNDGSGQLTLEEDVVDVRSRVWSYGMAAIDYDLNGDLDFFQSVRYDSDLERAGANQLYIATESSCNNAIQLELRGEASNSFGLGAKVWVYFTEEDGTTNGQLQEMVCLNTGGYSGQNGYRLYFGLAHAAEADSIRIDWPSGDQQTLTQIPAGFLYYIHESGLVEAKQAFSALQIQADVDPENPCRLRGLSASGNRGQIRWTNAATGAVLGTTNYLPIETAWEGHTLEVTDFCGRTASFAVPSARISVAIGPNPTTGLVQLGFNNLQENEIAQVTIWNASGQLVLKKEILLQTGQQEEPLDLQRYPAGTYLVQVNTDCGEIIEKIVLIQE